MLETLLILTVEPAPGEGRTDVRARPEAQPPLDPDGLSRAPAFAGTWAGPRSELLALSPRQPWTELLATLRLLSERSAGSPVVVVLGARDGDAAWSAIQALAGEGGGPAPGRGASAPVESRAAPPERSSPPGAALGATAQVGSPTRPTQRTVLVVDDTRVAREFVGEALRVSGYRVLQAAGAEEALAVSRAYPGPIDVLATDVDMPGLSGPELARSLRRERPGVKVLFSSGLPRSLAELTGSDGAADSGFLPKPVSMALLLREVARLLRGPGPPNPEG
ncbi:MAG: response regulator [Planctomycetes bacterium]|nr:response regulator [Planctomycetota bacterium]